MGDSSTLILSFVHIVEGAGFQEALCRNVEAVHCSLVDKIIGSTTVEECIFSHFVFVKKEADINAVLSVINIHCTYL